jgi:arylsulfatase I/J
MARSQICMALFLLVAGALATHAKPHIVVLLADDLGHAMVGKNTAVPDEIKTPQIDKHFATAGLTLNRHYTYKFCSPTRSSLQSGRLPVHVNTENAEPESLNPSDAVSGYAGIPVNMTTIASRLQKVGYQTYMTG